CGCLPSSPAIWTPTCTGRRSPRPTHPSWLDPMTSRARSFSWSERRIRHWSASVWRPPRLVASPVRPLPALPAELRANLPAELRGLRRDGVRLMVIDRTAQSIRHARLAELGSFLRAGDLLVVHRSRTIPAAVAARRSNGESVQLRLCVRHAEEWHVLCVNPDRPHATGALPGGERLSVAGPDTVVRGRRADLPLLWRIEALSEGIERMLRSGEPIRYSYVPEPVPLSHYETVYANEPGSAETPSAGRSLSWELLLDLRRPVIDPGDILL